MKQSRSGGRCFIIGNGPSLRVADLDAIRGEFSIAANRIYSVFPMTGWRPTLYVAQDVYDDRLADFVREHDAASEPGTTLITGAYFRRRWRLEDSATLAFLGLKSSLERGFSRDCAQSVCEFATVTFTSLQLAAYMGFKEIVLLGVDHAYSRTIAADGKVQLDARVRDHFYDGTEAPAPLADLNGMESAYAIARQACTEMGVEVFDATRGGRLQTFQKRSLEDVLSSGAH